VCRSKLLAEGAMDRVVVTMSSYRKLKKPLEDKDEEEFLMELCNMLSVCCMDAAGKQQFMDFEGIELMFIILRNRQTFRIGCLKVWLLAPHSSSVIPTSMKPPESVAVFATCGAVAQATHRAHTLHLVSA
jgi:hypothetical protein